ncbi:MAG: helix-turn-helix transcriptional regulator [Gemmiger sp.]|nr:helix-turn-helix transcriptional regulator [Gemmiger sp.]
MTQQPLCAQEETFPVYAFLHEDVGAGKGNRDKPRLVGSIEFALCLAACAARVNGETVQLAPGDVLVLPAISTCRGIRIVGGQAALPFDYICIDPHGLLENIRPVYIDFKSLLRHDNKTARCLLRKKECPIVSWLMQGILAEFREKNENYQVMVRGMVISLLVEVLRCRGDISDNIRFFSDEIQEIYPALRYLNRQGFGDSEVDCMAALCHMGTANFRRRFKQIMGESVTSYVSSQRLNQACERLLRTDVSVLEVALEVGFESLSSFNTLFVARMGETPSRWRRRMLADEEVDEQLEREQG